MFDAPLPRASAAIKSAPQPGGDVPPPGISTPTISEPRQSGAKPTPAQVRAKRIADVRARKQAFVDGIGNTDLLEQEPVAEPRRESNPPRPGFPRNETPKAERPCTKCGRPRGTTHGSYCTPCKSAHQATLRGKAPPFSTRTIAAPRPAEVLAARRAVSSPPPAPTARPSKTTPIAPVSSPPIAGKPCLECAAPRHPGNPRCLEHQRAVWRATDARRRGSAPPVVKRTPRLAANGKPACARCAEPRRPDAAYCNKHKAEIQRKYRAKFHPPAPEADRHPPPPFKPRVTLMLELQLHPLVLTVRVEPNS